MKKFLSVLLVTVFALSLMACGEKETAGDNAVEESTESNEEVKYGVGVTLDEVKSAVVDALGENYWPDAEINTEMMGSIYGVTEDMYEEYLGESPMISTNVDTLIVVKAKEDRIADVENALTAYRDVLINDSLQYPMNVGKIQASRIQTFGQYVCFVQLGADPTEGNEEISDEDVIKKCQEANELALEVIENTLVKNQ